MMKATRYLFDTSAVRPLLNWSTTEHVGHVKGLVADGEIWASVYVRKEYAARWVCDMIYAALVMDQSVDVADGMFRLEQEFGRKPKSSLAGISLYLRKVGTLPNDNPRKAAEELASAAIQALDDFDDAFGKLINNRSGCQIGGAKAVIDYDDLLATAHKFRETFQRPVLDCKVNTFIQIRNPKGRLSPFLSDSKASKLDAVKNAKSFQDSQTHITCRECGKIGDVVIALEQPASHCLVHTDHSYNELCRCLDRQHLEAPSVKAVDKQIKAERDEQAP
jgi:hypothetical protein